MVVSKDKDRIKAVFQEDQSSSTWSMDKEKEKE